MLKFRLFFPLAVLHKEERPFLCNKCGKRFKTGTQLKLHAARHNVVTADSETTTEPPPPDGTKQKHRGVTCDICSKLFGCAKLLRFHKERFHEQRRPHLCTFCGYSASSSSNLVLHVRSHTGEKR